MQSIHSTGAGKGAALGQGATAFGHNGGPPLEPMAYRIPDACYVLGIGRTSLYELVNLGELKLIKIAGRSLVPRSEIERLTSIDRAA